MIAPYELLDALRAGRALADEDLAAVVRGASEGSWGDAQLGAFLMGVAIRGLPTPQAAALTRAMRDSGDTWGLAADIPAVGDKHSTGGVGDKTSLVLGPLLAACGVPVVMLTGRGLGHTGGTADKLDSVPGLDQHLDRARARRLLDQVGLAVGIATAGIAPADRRLYALRDVTGTVRSLPLVVASILSKKLAAGAAALVLDVKTGSGAFFQDRAEASQLAHALVTTANQLGLPTSALLTDMSQPLGRWAGHTVEVEESLATLEGRGPADLLELTVLLSLELASQVGEPRSRAELQAAIDSGRAREHFDRWALAQGADPAWLRRPHLPRAPVERVLTAPRGGVLAAIDTEGLGLALAAAGGGRCQPGDPVDLGIALYSEARLGQAVIAGEPLARVYLRHDDDALVARFARCYTVADEGAAPPLVYEWIGTKTAPTP